MFSVPSAARSAASSGTKKSQRHFTALSRFLCDTRDGKYQGGVSGTHTRRRHRRRSQNLIYFVCKEQNLAETENETNICLLTSSQPGKSQMPPLFTSQAFFILTSPDHFSPAQPLQAPLAPPHHKSSLHHKLSN